MLKENDPCPTSPQASHQKAPKVVQKAPLSRKDVNSLLPIAFWDVQMAMEAAAGTSAKDDALVDTPDALLDQPF